MFQNQEIFVCFLKLMLEVEEIIEYLEKEITASWKKWFKDVM